MNATCHDEQSRDRWELVPDPDQHGVYLFRYFNSPDQCSTDRHGEPITSSDGLVTVALHVAVRGAEHEHMEQVWIEGAEAAGYLPVPHELWLHDGPEPGVIVLYPAMF